MKSNINDLLRAKTKLVTNDGFNGFVLSSLVSNLIENRCFAYGPINEVMRKCLRVELLLKGPMFFVLTLGLPLKSPINRRF